MMQMFEELWKQVEALRELPDTAIAQIPSILSDETKKKLCWRTAIEVSEIVRSAVAEINHGSIETVDALIRRRL